MLQAKYTLAFEITAHSRLLSSLVAHPTLPWLLTSAQDGTAAVWALPDDAGSDQEVTVVKSVLWQNGMITGASFCGASLRSIAMVAYDWEEIRIWSDL